MARPIPSYFLNIKIHSSRRPHKSIFPKRKNKSLDEILNSLLKYGHKLNFHFWQCGKKIKCYIFQCANTIRSFVELLIRQRKLEYVWTFSSIGLKAMINK